MKHKISLNQILIKSYKFMKLFLKFIMIFTQS